MNTTVLVNEKKCKETKSLTIFEVKLNASSTTGNAAHFIEVSSDEYTFASEMIPFWKRRQN